MKVGTTYYYYIHRAGTMYEIVYSNEDIDTTKESRVKVYTTRGSTIRTPACDLYYRLEDVGKQLYDSSNLEANSEFKTIEQYISHIRNTKINTIINGKENI